MYAYEGSLPCVSQVFNNFLGESTDRTKEQFLRMMKRAVSPNMLLIYRLQLYNVEQNEKQTAKNQRSMLTKCHSKMIAAKNKSRNLTSKSLNAHLNTPLRYPLRSLLTHL